MARATGNPTDENMHEWRKAVKNLWYQMRLLESVASSVLTPLVATLDELAEELGEDHDLAVLVDRLRSNKDDYGGKKSVKKAVKLARTRQRQLRARAFRLGSTIYAEPPSAFVTRLEGYWRIATSAGAEPPHEVLAGLVEGDKREAGTSHEALVERERKYLVSSLPDLEGKGTILRQGYLALDGTVSVRVRDSGGRDRTLTIKAGTGAVRTELEWQMTGPEFDTAWELTGGRRIHKVRHEVPWRGHVIEIDVFADDLEGLVTAEVEFESDAALAEFEPPGWFGRDVTDDVRYTNASLAVDGLDREDFE
jgi:CYTH domain-containing protein